MLDDKTRSNFNCASSEYLRFGVVKEKENKNASEFQVDAHGTLLARDFHLNNTRVSVIL